MQVDKSAAHCHVKARTHDATLRATFASRSCTQCCRRWTHGETVARDVAEIEADFTSATVARNVARNNFNGGHTMQLPSCARCCGQCCIVCPRLKFVSVNFFEQVRWLIKAGAGFCSMKWLGALLYPPPFDRVSVHPRVSVTF